MTNAILNNKYGYSGTLTLSLSEQGRIMKTYKLHNEGKDNLFRFFAHALAGNTIETNELRPKNLALLKKDPSGNGYSLASGYVAAESNAIVEDNVARLSFKISISDAFGDFDHIGLYPANVTMTEDEDNPSAVFSLKDLPENSDSILSLRDSSSTTILLVDWELEVANAGKISSGEN